MIMALASAMSVYKELIYSLVPFPSVLISAGEQGDADELIFLIIALMTTLLCVVIPLLRHRSAFREFRHYLKHA